MFQDLSSKFEKTKDIFGRLFKVENILLYIISFAVSRVTFLDEMNPFSMAFLAAVYLSGIPVFGVVLCSMLGLVLSFGKAPMLMYILSSIAFIGMSVIYKAKRMDEEIEIGLKLFFSVLLVGLVRNIGKTFLVYDTLILVTSSICTVIFYVVFLKAIPLISDIKMKKVFSKEELIATSILLVIAISSLGDLQVFGFVIREVLSILVILILGWKNGALVGTTSRNKYRSYFSSCTVLEIQK